jgi:beta-glucosidase
LDGIKEELGENVKIYSDTVCDYYGETPKSFASTIKNIKDADLIIYVGGISPRIEGEEMNVDVKGFYKGDRTSILLPQIQTDLLKALKATGKPVIFVMMTGSAIAIPWESENLDAILNSWYGGEFAGKAIADVLFGNYNPSGHLPVTFYADDSDLPDFEDYDMSNRTYKYFRGKAIYPFGFGLSYTKFDYQWGLQPQKTYRTGEMINAVLKVKNIGEKEGDEVAQAYIKYPNKGRLPVKELRQFERKSIHKGETVEIKINIPVDDLAKWSDELGKTMVYPGIYSIYVGSNSEDEAIVSTFEIQ